MEATNIDDAQIAAGVTGSDVVAARDTNRLEMFRDFNVDLGGFIKKDKLWWYGAFRRTDTGQRYPTLLDDIQDTWVPVATAKATVQRGREPQDLRVLPPDQGTAGLPGRDPHRRRPEPALMTKDTVWHSTFPLHVWKAEYERGAVAGALLRGAGRCLPLRVGAARASRPTPSRTSATTSSRAASGPRTSGAIGRRPMRRSRT